MSKRHVDLIKRLKSEADFPYNDNRNLLREAAEGGRRVMSCKCYHADKNFLGSIGVCWGTKECEACSCGGDEAKCDFYDYVRGRVKKPITNADRIRAMSDEVLAEWLTMVEVRIIECNPMLERPAMKADWLDWLKQEADT